MKNKAILWFAEIIALIVIAITLFTYLDSRIKKEEQQAYETVKEICKEKNLTPSEAYTKTGDKYYVCK